MRIFVISFLILYFILGKSTDYFRTGEIFPIYSWQLFSFVPQKTITEFAIEIQELQGKKLETPQLFQNMRSIIPGASLFTAYRTIQNLGRAQTRNNSIKTEKLKKQFEDLYLKLPAKYDLIQITFDPLERWENGTYQKTHIKTFYSSNL